MKKANIIHNQKYNYDDINYQNSKTKIGITCPLHGIFYQSPGNHLQGQGCSKCKSEKLSLLFRGTRDNFIKKAKKTHGDQYDYSLSEYKGYHSLITIICKKHGQFIQKANNHLYGAGCPKCGLSAISKNLKEENGKMYRTCSMCKKSEEETENNFYKRKRGGFSSWCKICSYKEMIKRTRELKSKAIKYKGGKCIVCGYNKCNRSLDFHHICPSEKDFHIADGSRDFEKIKEELDKCILLCKNCHGELHNGLITI